MRLLLVVCVVIGLQFPCVAYSDIVMKTELPENKSEITAQKGDYKNELNVDKKGMNNNTSERQKVQDEGGVTTKPK